MARRFNLIVFFIRIIPRLSSILEDSLIFSLSTEMRKAIYISAAFVLSTLYVFSQIPDAEVFTVIKKNQAYGPKITALLRYQTALAWKQDEVRRENLKNIKTEKELLALQHATREKLLAMIGGLPVEKTPLRPQIQGKIQMNGFYIEKLVFESVPGF